MTVHDGADITGRAGRDSQRWGGNAESHLFALVLQALVDLFQGDLHARLRLGLIIVRGSRVNVLHAGTTNSTPAGYSLHV